MPLASIPRFRLELLAIEAHDQRVEVFCKGHKERWSLLSGLPYLC